MLFGEDQALTVVAAPAEFSAQDVADGLASAAASLGDELDDREALVVRLMTARRKRPHAKQ